MGRWSENRGMVVGRFMLTKTACLNTPKSELLEELGLLPAGFGPQIGNALKNMHIITACLPYILQSSRNMPPVKPIMAQ